MLLQVTKDNNIEGAVFAKNSAILVANHGWRRICVWVLKNGWSTPHTTIQINCNTFDVTQSGDVIAVPVFSSILFFDTYTGSRLAVYLGLSERIDSLRFSHDGHRLVSSSSSFCGNTRVWDTSQEALSAHSTVTQNRPLTRVIFSPDGKCIAAIAEDDPRIFI